jgi:hypothetical protein
MACSSRIRPPFVSAVDDLKQRSSVLSLAYIWILEERRDTQCLVIHWNLR